MTNPKQSIADVIQSGEKLKRGVSMSWKTERLRAVLPDVSETTIQTIAQTEQIIEYPEGHILCKEGAYENTAFILLEGQVDIYKHEGGGIHFLDSMTGGVIGDLTLLLDTPRNADVVAATPIKVLEVTREEFNGHAQANPELAIEISKLVLARVLHQMDTLLFELAQHRRRAEEQPNFFMSYSRKDEDFVRTLAGDLRRRGFKIWLDIYDIEPGESWSRQIGRALDACEVMLLILSPDALDSENVDDEWNYFLDVKKTVLPIMHRPCTIPFRLHKLQYINFTNQSYDTALDRLVATLYQQQK